MMLEKKCLYCNKIFVPRANEHFSHFGIRKFCKLRCSADFLRSKNLLRIAANPRTCTICHEIFYRKLTEGVASFRKRDVCSYACAGVAHGKRMTGVTFQTKKSRKMISRANSGKNNGMYVHGQCTGGKHSPLRNRKHEDACKAYKEKINSDYGYLFCEMSGWEIPCSLLRLETHHIIFASEAPYHENLHNFRNLVLVCKPHHVFFHMNKAKREKIVRDRKLIELFPEIIRGAKDLWNKDV